MQLGESEVFDSAQQSEEIRLFRRMAFGSQNYRTDFFSRASLNPWKGTVYIMEELISKILWSWVNGWLWLSFCCLQIWLRCLHSCFWFWNWQHHSSTWISSFFSLAGSFGSNFGFVIRICKKLPSTTLTITMINILVDLLCNDRIDVWLSFSCLLHVMNFWLENKKLYVFCMRLKGGREWTLLWHCTDNEWQFKKNSLLLMK